VAALKCEPLFRALRCDKLCFAALQVTIDLHLNQAATEIPAIAILQVTEDELRDRATAISSDLTDLPLQIAIGRGAARVGGGTLPKSTTSSITIEMVPKNCSPVEFAARLRKSAPPLIGYIANNRLKIDLRTIFPQQDKAVIEAIRAACFERV
jgi:L-seryl-tRNA(Ser) seleniumtransferase